MRVDPGLYPLIYNRIVYTARLRFGTDTCLPLDQCPGYPQTNCCPDMLTRMEVGSIRYVTLDPDASAWMRSSTVETASETYKTDANGVAVQSYSLEDIADGVGSPYDTCIQLVIAAQAYYDTTAGADGQPLPADGLFLTAMNEMCAPAACASSSIAGLCALCDKFEGTQAPAVVSCSGYDLDVNTVPFNTMIGLTAEVTNSEKNSNLFLLNIGFQAFAVGLLNGPVWTPNSDDPFLNRFKDRSAVVSPQFGKQLESVTALHAGAPVANTSQLVDEQIQGTSSASSDGVRLSFADGSATTSKAVYLSMLPYDLAHLEDFGDWSHAYDEVAPDIVGAVKVVFGWSNTSEALPARV
eukprot:gene8552-7806_t